MRAVIQDQLAISSEMRAEIHHILTSKFRWPTDRANYEIDVRLAFALLVQLTHTTHICRDPDDDMFLECAAIAKADVIVAGDKDLLVLRSYCGTPIITPSEYVVLKLS